MSSWPSRATAASRTFGSSLLRPSASLSIWPAHVNLSARAEVPSSSSPSAARNAIIAGSMSRRWRLRRHPVVGPRELVERPLHLFPEAVGEVELEHGAVFRRGAIEVAPRPQKDRE